MAREGDVDLPPLMTPVSNRLLQNLSVADACSVCDSIAEDGCGESDPSVLHVAKAVITDSQTSQAFEPAYCSLVIARRRTDPMPIAVTSHRAASSACQACHRSPGSPRRPEESGCGAV